MSTIAIKSPRTTFRAFSEIESLVRAFEKAEIANEDFDHRSHVVVACWYQLVYPFNEATDRMRNALLHYLATLGIKTTPERGYHETITVAWMHLVRDYLAGTNLDCSLVELINGLTDHFRDKDSLSKYYTKERLMSLEARAVWVEPDLRPLP